MGESCRQIARGINNKKSNFVFNVKPTYILQVKLLFERKPRHVLEDLYKENENALDEKVTTKGFF